MRHFIEATLGAMELCYISYISADLWQKTHILLVISLLKDLGCLNQWKIVLRQI